MTEISAIMPLYAALCHRSDAGLPASQLLRFSDIKQCSLTLEALFIQAKSSINWSNNEMRTMTIAEEENVK